MPALEEAIRAKSTSKKKLDPRVLAHLAVAVYQLQHTRVPAFAAVTECVGAIRETHGPKVAAFANAVLRKLSAEGEKERTASQEGGKDLGSRAVLPVLPSSAELSPLPRARVPQWLRAALERSLGAEGAARFLEDALVPPPVCLRVERRGERDVWLAKLRAAAPRATFEPGTTSPHAILARGAGKPQLLPGYRDGAWSVQEEGSQLVALAVGARPGDRVLDACAGRGNKSAMLARAVGKEGVLDAADLHPKKLARLREELARTGLAPSHAFAVDWSVGAGEVQGVYDRVLVDAPCSGTGTLRRRPELALRRAPEDLAALSDLQLRITSRAAERVRPGGRLTYAVCSVLREEGEEVVAKLLASHPELSPASFDSGDARAIAGDAPTLLLLPSVNGTDGYFVAGFVKVEGVP